MLSATHHSNGRCKKESCVKNAIDMAPSLYSGFGYDFSYFNSNGEVIASNSGIVVIHSTCSMAIKSQIYSTYYSHISITRSNGEFVRLGEVIGHIQLDRKLANCECDISDGETECSLTGPHLHWEVRGRGGEPWDLNHKIISGYKIYTGDVSYDFGCNQTTNCRSNMTVQEIESSCSTVFLRMKDNKTLCPSVQGANKGKTQ